jgi:hypothetical protein
MKRKPITPIIFSQNLAGFSVSSLDEEIKNDNDHFAIDVND